MLGTNSNFNINDKKKISTFSNIRFALGMITCSCLQVSLEKDVSEQDYLAWRLAFFFLVSSFLPPSPFLRFSFTFLTFFFIFLSPSLSVILSNSVPSSSAFRSLSSSDGGHKSSCCQRPRLAGLCNAAIHLEPEERTRLRPHSTHHSCLPKIES